MSVERVYIKSGDIVVTHREIKWTAYCDTEWGETQLANPQIKRDDGDTIYRIYTGDPYEPKEDNKWYYVSRDEDGRMYYEIEKV